MLNAVEDAFHIDFPKKNITILAKQLEIRSKKSDVGELSKTLQGMAKMPLLPVQRDAEDLWWKALGVRGQVDKQAIKGSRDIVTSVEDYARASKRRLRSLV